MLSDAAGVFAAEGAAVRLNGAEIYAEASVTEGEGIPGTAAGIASHGADVEMTGGSIQASSAVISAAEKNEEREGTSFCIYNADGRLTISGGELRGRLFSSGGHTIVGGAFSVSPEEYLTKDYRIKTAEGAVCCYLVLHIPVLTAQDLPETDGVLPHPASFRFRFSADTLTFSYFLSATGRIRVFYPLETCAAGHTMKKSPARKKFSWKAFFAGYLLDTL